jgi:hypothetical protein
MILPFPVSFLKDPALSPADDAGAPQWIYLVTAALLVLLGGAFAGLTIA